VGRGVIASEPRLEADRGQDVIVTSVWNECHRERVGPFPNPLIKVRTGSAQSSSIAVSATTFSRRSPSRPAETGDASASTAA
jgi:hypothetical protein